MCKCLLKCCPLSTWEIEQFGAHFEILYIGSYSDGGEEHCKHAAVLRQQKKTEHGRDFCVTHIRGALLG